MEYRFRVEFSEEAKGFLDTLEEKRGKRSFITFGNLVAGMTKIFSKNLEMKFGNSELHIISHITDSLHSGTKQTN